ncbi:uncharacterized protein LOC144124038 [Amblyomma americanum]
MAAEQHKPSLGQSPPSSPARFQTRQDQHRQANHEASSSASVASAEFLLNPGDHEGGNHVGSSARRIRSYVIGVCGITLFVIFFLLRPNPAPTAASHAAPVQILLTCLLVRAYALQHHQAGYQGAGYGGYVGPAAGSPYRGYDGYATAPQPYSFGYDTVDEYGNRQFRSEQGDVNNVKTGSYGYRDVNGLYRRVNYVADANGFRATVDTNEPGTAPGSSADVVFNAAPVVPPVPGGAGAPAAYGSRALAPGYNNGGYGRFGGYGGYGSGGAYGYGGYGRYGAAPNGRALGGYAYGGNTPYGYGAAGYAGGRYAPAGYGAAGGWAAGYRRRR